MFREMTRAWWLTIGAGIGLVVVLMAVALLSQPLATTRPSPTSAGAKPAINTTDKPLVLPDGFRVDLFAEGLARARVLTFDSEGTLLLSINDAGEVVALPDTDKDGQADEKLFVAQGLDRPHGLQFLPNGKLLIAETGRLGQWHYDLKTRTVTFEKAIYEMPEGGSHATRTVRLGTDGKIYLSIGSSCNVCKEEDERRATIMRMNPDGSNVERWAYGLRNTVFFTPNPKTGDFWGNDMGRDHLGDDLPPDELNIIPVGNVQAPGDYGWPNCYGDRAPDPFGGISVSCQVETKGAHYNHPAHSAPLGIAFIPQDKGWPKEMEGDVLVSYHGSWNRTTKLGYQVTRLDLNDQQKVVAAHDFLTGFLQPGEAVLGRPVDLIFDASGTLFISDDDQGRVYRVKPL